MKNRRFWSFVAIVLILASFFAFSASAATTVKSYTLSQQDLVGRVNKVAKQGQITYTSFYNINDLPASRLRVAASAANRLNSKVFFCFDTLIKDHVYSRVIVNPLLVPESDKRSFNFVIDIDKDNTKVIREKFEKKFERKVAVMKCAQTEDFGFAVILASKLDLSEMDAENLIAYHYDESNGTYSEITKANCTVDKEGFLFIQTKKAGCIIITEAA